MRFLIICTLISNVLFAQSINPSDGELYRDDVVPRVDVTLPQDSLDIILDPANKDSDYEFHATFVFDNGTVRDTFDNVGFRLRGNTSRNSKKQSFKISFNTYMPGRKYYGVEKINLNGEHNDPTIARSKTCWELADTLGLAASRTNHVNFYINNQYRGVYLNVEHIDEEFVEKRYGNKGGNLYKCTYPADLVYKGADPDLYKEIAWGKRIYELKTNELQDDYSDLANFIDILNNTPVNDLPCELEAIFNVDRYLKAMVFDILTGNWDGPLYNKNNFYLYQNQSTGKLEYIPFDLDNTFGIDWLGLDWGIRNMYLWRNLTEPRPLYTRLMAVPAYRDRFSLYMNEAMSAVFKSSYLNPRLDDIRDLIAPYVAQDTFYPLSYGYSMQDFRDAYSMALPAYRHTIYGVKSYISTRRREAQNQLILNDVSPIITQTESNHPTENQDVKIRASVRDDHTLAMVELCYHLGNPGNETCVAMLDDGLNDDGQAGDGVFGIILPALNRQEVLEYYIKASDSRGNESLEPPCGYHKLFVGSSSVPLAINEFMADNKMTIMDNVGEYEDWVEVYNYGTSAIYLGDKYLSDDNAQPDKWAMPDAWIAPGAFLLFWADDDTHQGDYHTNFKLSKGGEFVGIFDNGVSGYGLIDGLTFTQQKEDTTWGRIPNGTGAFSFLTPTPGQSNTAVSIEPFYQIKFSAYPNPFQHQLSIRIDNPEGRLLTIECVDMLGRKWAAFEADDRQIREGILLTNAPKGLMVIRGLNRGGLIAVRKVVRR